MGSIPEIIDSIKESIIVIKINNVETGTGFFVNEKGLFLTNKHTIGINRYANIILHNSREIQARIIRSDNDIDFAFGLSEIPNNSYLKFSDSSLIKEGEEVFAIGHPYGYEFTLSRGIVSCKERIVRGIKYIQTDVPINPGNSGGPLINSEGNVIGIITWIVGEAENMSFAIPSNSVKEIFNHLSQNFEQIINMYYCPICGSLNDKLIKTKNYEYCPNCGTRRIDINGKSKPENKTNAKDTKASSLLCPNCKSPIDEFTNFCKICGYKIK